MGKVIGVVAIKGGVGKTTAVANLGAALANVFNKKVLLVDANFSAPNLGLHLGIPDADVTLHHVLSGRCSMNNAIYNTDYGMDFVPAALRGPGNIRHLQLKRHIDSVKKGYDIVLVDSSPNLNNEILATMLASDELLVVSTPDYPTLSCTMHAVKVAKRKKIPITGIILNRSYNKKFELTADDIEQAAEVPVIGLLPHEIGVLEALSLVKPTVLHTPASDAAVEYCKIAACLVGEDFKDKRLITKIRKIFPQPIKKHEINREVMRDKENNITKVEKK